MKGYRYFIASIICLCMLGMGGCSEEGSKTEEKFPMAVDAGKEEGSRREQGDIQETVTENVTVNARMEIPEKTFAIYDTEYKAFDRQKLMDLLCPQSSKEEIKSREGADISEITLGEENLVVEAGFMSYYKNNKVKSLSDLASYGEEKNLLEKKDLAFMTREEAIHKAEVFLSSLELGGDLGEGKLFSLSKENMLSMQSSMKNDEDYKELYELGKFKEQAIDAEDEMYYIKYSFALEGLPILGEGDPEVQISGGEDRFLLAIPMKAELFISNSGICQVRIDGAVDRLQAEDKNQEIMGFEGIRKALVKKFGDVILSDSYNLVNMRLEYFPRLREDSFDKVEVIPVWRCDFVINGENNNYSLRFHAVTGEEIS